MRRVSRRRALAALGLTGTTLLAGCNAVGSDDDEPTEEPEEDEEDTDTGTETTTSSEPATDSESIIEESEPDLVDEPYKFGLSPSAPQSFKEDMYEPLSAYLSEELVETELRDAATYSATLDALRNGTFAFAETGPFAAGFAIKNGDANVALQRRAFGTWNYTSVVVTREDSDIERLDDLDGGTIAFADKTSASGSLFPLWMLDRAGLGVGDAPESDQAADFTATWSSHAQAFKSVADDQADAACVGKFITLRSQDTVKDGFEYVATYEGIPRAPMLTSPNLSPEATQAFVEALQNAPDDVYQGADEEPNTDDDLWFSDVRPTDAATYEPVVQVIDDLELTRDVLDQ